MEHSLASARSSLPTPFTLGKPQQVTVLVQQQFLFALCKELTTTSDTIRHLGSEVT